jgi:hypothetical protein
MSLRKSDRYWTGRHGLPVSRRVEFRRVFVDMGRNAKYTVEVKNQFSHYQLTLLVSPEKPKGLCHYDGRMGSQEYHDTVNDEGIGNMTAIEFFEAAVGCSLKVLEKSYHRWLYDHPEIMEMMHADEQLLGYAIG